LLYGRRRCAGTIFGRSGRQRSSRRAKRASRRWQSILLRDRTSGSAVIGGTARDGLAEAAATAYDFGQNHGPRALTAGSVAMRCTITAVLPTTVPSSKRVEGTVEQFYRSGEADDRRRGEAKFGTVTVYGCAARVASFNGGFALVGCRFCAP